MTRTRALKLGIPLAVVLGLLALFAVAGTLSQRGSPSLTTEESGGADGRMSGSVAGDMAEKAPQYGDGASIDVNATIPAASAPSAHYLVRNGALSLLVPRGELLRAVDRVTALTTAMGGYVVASSVGSEPIPWPAGAEPALEDQSGADGSVVSSGEGYATITVRVPERQFDTALRRYAGLGEVEGVSTSSQDVTSQYVDLQARLDHYRAVERRLIRFLAETDNVPQMLAVQDRIDKVQLTIEQLTAELKSLRETTTYGTISLSLNEKGRHETAAAGTSFWGTFWNSMELLGSGARATAYALVAVLPFVIVFGGLALVAWLAARRLRRRRSAAPPSLPA